MARASAGPLLKNNVEELLRATPRSTCGTQPACRISKTASKIRYFALSPEDEARDAARHIRYQGKQAPLGADPDAVHWAIA
ncbi:penicillin-binding protein activator [Escherichia coli]